MTDHPTRDPSLRIVLLPKDTNANGTIFGGIILSHIDLAGAVEAKKSTRESLVTVAIKEVVFKHPVWVGEVVSFYTRTLKIGNSSVTVSVDVEVIRQGENIKVTEAELTFVAVDESGRPKPLQPVAN
jgi:acyl-CoA thioesterase YciA